MSRIARLAVALLITSSVVFPASGQELQAGRGPLAERGSKGGVASLAPPVA